MSCRLPAVLAVVALVGAGGCGDGDEDRAEPAALEGEWDVSLVIGLVDADPAAELGFATDATYVERWVLEDCDDDGCTLRRPDGGFLFGDLDGMRIEAGDGVGLEGDDGERRFVGEGSAAALPSVDADQTGLCARAPTERWAVRVELDVRDQVLSGSAFRTPEALSVEVDGVTCYGYDLTVGLSGTPAR